jgi:deoxyribodipyrimidine photolyase-related protein
LKRVRTIWVFGDQLNRGLGALETADPTTDRILLIESTRMIESRAFHRQRLHLVLTAMRRFADELESEGFAVDLRQAPSLRAGLEAHRSEHRPDLVVATEPNGRAIGELVDDLEVDTVRSNQFLCHRKDFAEWAGGRKRLLMEDFYRWQRRRLGYLMDGDEPVGGTWNYDHDNRRPPPSGDVPWPEPLRFQFDDLDRLVIAELPATAVGADPVGWWPTSRSQALRQLDHFVDDVLPHFGPHEDAMLDDDWHLAHSMLSPAMNLGLLLPGEVCDRVEARFGSGGVPLNSAEGFIRQVIGWREYIWGIYWLWPDHEQSNAFGHDNPLPPAFRLEAPTEMTCLESAVGGLRDRAWVHHIQRLMVLSNISNLVGVDPVEVRDWMREMYIDGGDWVMGPNVFGMGLWSDGGRMATKPYVSGGAYINRMSNHCKGCRFDPRQRVGDDACPLTTLYWDFLDRNRSVLGDNHRMSRQYGMLDRLSDMDGVRARAVEVLDRMLDGRL